MHSPVLGQREKRGIRKERNIDCNAECNRAHRGTPEGILGFSQQCESGSRAQTIASDSHGAHNQASFASVGCPTKTFHEGENTMLIDEANGRVGPAAKSSGDIKDITTLAYQCSDT